MTELESIPPYCTPVTWSWPLVAELACRMWKVVTTRPVQRHLVVVPTERVI
jgi:hypothetical protein